MKIPTRGLAVELEKERHTGWPRRPDTFAIAYRKCAYEFERGRKEKGRVLPASRRRKGPAKRKSPMTTERGGHSYLLRRIKLITSNKTRESKGEGRSRVSTDSFGYSPQKELGKNLPFLKNVVGDSNAVENG